MRFLVRGFGCALFNFGGMTMKKALWLVLVLFMVCILTFSACSSDDTSHNSNGGNNQQTTEGSVGDNNGGEKNNNSNTPVVCQHTFGDWNTTKQATCKDEGELVRVCSKCSAEEKTTVAKTNVHTVVIDIAVAATCTETGLTEGKHCSRCNTTLVAQTTVGALGHAEVIDAAVAPTCTETGLTEGKHCSRCNTTLVAQTTVAALGHAEVIDAAVAPTCTETGLTEGKHCSVCNVIFLAQEIVPISHSWPRLFEYDIEVHWKKCNLCNTINSREAHDLGDEGICSICGNAICATNGIIYGLSDDNSYAIVLGYTGTATKIRIAAEYGGLPVKAIHSEAFKNTPIVSVVVPDTITSIGYEAFYSCESLANVMLTDNVTSIGARAFYNCTSLTSITIPNRLQSIGESMFFHCTSLTNIIIPDSVTSIMDKAFYYCTALQSIAIPDTVTCIGDKAFSNCHSSIYTEYWCVKYIKANGNANEILIGITNKNLTSYEILANTTIISNSAFSNCEKLTTIEIPSSVKNIGYAAFYGCKSLESITIPFIGSYIENHTYTHFGYIFGASSYSENRDFVPTNLKNVIVTEPINIEYAAFYGCTSIENITIPFIRNSVVGGTDAHFGYIFGASSYLENKNFIPSNLKNVVITDATGIDAYAFYECNSLENVAIPYGVTTIAYAAFFNCNSLTSIEIPNSVTNIGLYAFRECSSLKSVLIGNSVNAIGDYAFCDCDSITNVIIPESVTSIGNYAFSSCSSLTSVILPCNLTNISDGLFSGCTSLITVRIPDSIIGIGEFAFWYCTLLTDINYTGSETKWSKITINKGNTGLTNATIYYNYTPEK